MKAPRIVLESSSNAERRMTGFAGHRRRETGDRAVLLSPVFCLPFPVIIRAIHGRVGDVVYKTYVRKIVVTHVPCFDGHVPTPAQRARRTRMAEATAYAKRIYADPAANAHYVAAAKHLARQSFRLAISDYLNGHPRVALQKQPGDATPSSRFFGDEGLAAPSHPQSSNPPNLLTGGNGGHGGEANHCEKQSDEAIQPFDHPPPALLPVD